LTLDVSSNTMKRKVYKRQINDQGISYKKWPPDVALPYTLLVVSHLVVKITTFLIFKSYYY